MVTEKFTLVNKATINEVKTPKVDNLISYVIIPESITDINIRVWYIFKYILFISQR